MHGIRTEIARKHPVSPIYSSPLSKKQGRTERRQPGTNVSTAQKTGMNRSATSNRLEMKNQIGVRKIRFMRKCLMN